MAWMKWNWKGRRLTFGEALDLSQKEALTERDAIKAYEALASYEKVSEELRPKAFRARMMLAIRMEDLGFVYPPPLKDK